MTDQPLFKFQEDMVQFLTDRDKAFMAADMGLGKTRVAIEAAARRGLARKLVVAPAIGLVSWPSEFSKWSPQTQVWAVQDPSLLPDAPEGDVCAVVPFSEVQRQPRLWVEAAARYKSDVTIVDEAHFAKEATSARTQALYGWRCDLQNAMIDKDTVTWPMSGTPAPNYTSELWTHLRALAPATIISPRTGQPMPYTEFLERFAVTRISSYGQHVTGSKDTERLRLATNSFFHRIRKAEARPDMPPILWTYEPVPISSEGFNLPADVPDAALIDHLNNAYPSGSSARKAVGLVKVPGVVEWARAFLSGSDRKLIIFAWHRDVVRQITQALGTEFGAVSIDGDTTLALRNHAVSSFQLPGGPRVFVGQMLACGTMLTLTAASDVAFAEDDWTPGIMEQAAARADRLGQTRGVRAVILHSPTRKDQRIARVRVDKAAGLALMFGKSQTEGT